MRYEYQSSVQNCYANSLRYIPDKRELKWSMSNCNEVIIVQTPYGVLPTSCEENVYIEKLCRFMAENNIELRVNEYVNVTPEVWVLYMDSSANLRQGKSCAIREEAFSYTVFPCKLANNVLTVYGHGVINHISSPYVHLTVNFNCRLAPVFRTERSLFRRKEVYAGFYLLTLPSELSEFYKDGSIKYTVKPGKNEISVPITRGMLEQTNVYIRVPEDTPAPKLSGDLPGFTLTVHQ